MNKLVTIGIPAYNRLEFLKEAVASALAQTYPHIEVLISQNPNQDREVTESIKAWCQELASKNPKVRYQLNPQNNGSPANFNAIADGARGEYVAFIGDDDRLLPDFAEKLVAVIQPDTNLAFSNHYLMDADGQRMLERTDKCTKQYGRADFSPGAVNAKVAAWQAAVPFFACLIKTEDFRRIRFREDIGTPDWEFFILLAQEDANFVFIPDYLSEVRVHNRRASAAGLHFEMLVPYLLPIPVGEEIEPYKRKLLAPIVSLAVTCHLLDRKLSEAKELMSSNYYPRYSFKGLLQHFCISLPEDLGCNLYQLIYNAKKSNRLQQQKKAHSFSLFPAK